MGRRQAEHAPPRLRTPPLPPSPASPIPSSASSTRPSSRPVGRAELYVYDPARRCRGPPGPSGCAWPPRPRLARSLPRPRCRRASASPIARMLGEELEQLRCSGSEDPNRVAREDDASSTTPPPPPDADHALERCTVLGSHVSARNLRKPLKVTGPRRATPPRLSFREGGVPFPIWQATPMLLLPVQSRSHPPNRWAAVRRAAPWSAARCVPGRGPSEEGRPARSPRRPR